MILFYVDLRGYYDRKKIGLLTWASFISYFVPIIGGDGIKGGKGWIVILARQNFHIIREQENLV